MTLLEKIQEDFEEEEGQPFWAWGSKYNVIESEMVDQRRWVTMFRDVISHPDFPGEYVAVCYDQGSTEMQFDEDINAEFSSVVPKEVVTTIYVEVK